ncbi:hypothetical protein J6590_086200 [Homalodisca vitripennis]|nr:hypothetical protein J6590_086200 [Homalodisca vitripennis]
MCQPKAPSELRQSLTFRKYMYDLNQASAFGTSRYLEALSLQKFSSPWLRTFRHLAIPGLSLVSASRSFQPLTGTGILHLWVCRIWLRRPLCLWELSALETPHPSSTQTSEASLYQLLGFGSSFVLAGPDLPWSLRTPGITNTEYCSLTLKKALAPRKSYYLATHGHWLLSSLELPSPFQVWAYTKFSSAAKIIVAEIEILHRHIE